ncbi:hypothetical protein FisN_22Lh148 [Fistulifera solaris]|uniref:Uncharacterized protein n=1 Tax=Fistulifera solaris TaxID=1519565 RepID=A0A1Z5JBS5_FISSO|nr:hypothetical protein FisN_22Lh148 [Fistulifera solaris]|eukprot:GAX11464.1 hypothetical protein FisN_22Lh148 [Fistulifera solaris]
MKLRISLLLVVAVRVQSFHSIVTQQPFPFQLYSSSAGILSETVSVETIGDCLGSGSYGTVHLLQTVQADQRKTWLVGKRAWTLEELREQRNEQQSKKLEELAERCRYYLDVEAYCLSKFQNQNNIVPFRGRAKDEQGREWMLMDMMKADEADGMPHASSVAPSLQDIIEQDRTDPHNNHHLFYLSAALGVHGDLSQTLDVVISNLLHALKATHELGIVHRDVKPGNLLVVPSGRLVLLDFGSAADLSPKGWFAKRMGWEQDRVAVSPIYAAPEVFINPTNVQESLTFDCFSAGLLICQLLFQYLDERTESGFHQQRESVDCDLDEWLRTALASKVSPAGMDDAMDVLQKRPGLWRLLKSLLQKDPRNRISSAKALELWYLIQQNASTEIQKRVADARLDDGAYLKDCLELYSSCPVTPTVWPLHFVATFDRRKPLGLYLSEVDLDEETKAELSAEDRKKWDAATSDMPSGEVFVQGLVPDSQADILGIFQVGDRLEGVGELPVSGAGFEKVLELLKDQPKQSKFVTLHFARKSAIQVTDMNENGIMDGPVKVVDQGAWTTKGRRPSQEDAYIMHEVLGSKESSLLLAGVADGHLGRAASSFVKSELPLSVSEILWKQSRRNTSLGQLLFDAWDQVCEKYRSGCISGEECAADYNPREGFLMANTGSVDAIAGTTTCLVAVDSQTSQMSFLNCGDSRGLVVDKEGKLVYITNDHTPEYDQQRLTEGRSQGKDYEPPLCRAGRWSVAVGDFCYALARSLEGPFATSKGIVSEPDIDQFHAPPGATVVVATDGLWEVMDSEQVAHIITKMRRHSESAAEVAKVLCALAVQNGSSDNVSAVVVYME